MSRSEYAQAFQEALTRQRAAPERETGVRLPEDTGVTSSQWHHAYLAGVADAVAERQRRVASAYAAAFTAYNLRSDGGDGNR